MRDATAAEDVLQEAMVRALTYFPGFRGVNPRGWLLQIVRNAAYGSMKLNRGIELVPIANGEENGGAAIAELPSGGDEPGARLIKAPGRSQGPPPVGALPVGPPGNLVLSEFQRLSFNG